MSKPAIALYLGESYASIGLFDISKKNKPISLLEKSVFLPQVSLKNLLNQVKQKAPEYFIDGSSPIPVYVVTKYLDRLKHFRLGGSISQVILKGFENSYTLKDSKSLSLAAAQLIITIESSTLNEAYLSSELERIKKINPDLNKVVISLPEESILPAQKEMLYNFFTSAGLKIFTCSRPENQNELRKTLLNAGSEGTKEEIITDIKECLSQACEVYFFCQNNFLSQFENCELFNSSNNFLAAYLKANNYHQGAYFDIESLKFINLHKAQTWASPWGPIPVEYTHQTELSTHLFSEVKLNHLSILDIESSVFQLEPGPVVAGRAIKPLVLDLFFNELQSNAFATEIFTQLKQDSLKAKIQNLFSVLEKGQKTTGLAIQISELKKIILKTIASEISFYSDNEKTLCFGSLSEIFSPDKQGHRFSWPQEIIKISALKEAL